MPENKPHEVSWIEGILLLVFLVPVALLVYRCEREPTPEEQARITEGRMTSDAMNQVRNRMRDPDSAKFGRLRVSHASGRFALCGTVNAQNAFGGYVGYRRYVATPSMALLAEDDPDLFAKFWAEMCGSD